MDVKTYTKASDQWIKADVEICQAKNYNWIIDRVTEEELENKGKVDYKPTLWFRGQEKGFPLNKTNCAVCVDNFGSTETDDWVGRKVQLYRTMTSSPSGLVPCIRIRPQGEIQGSPSTPQDSVDGEDEDNIPF